MVSPQKYHFDLPDQSPKHATIDEEWYPNIQTAALKASSGRIYDSVLGIRSVVIHATVGSTSAGAASVIHAKKASFHWLIPDEDEKQHGSFVWATCHEARAAWHVRNAVSHPLVWGGKSGINHHSLGIELVNTQKSSDTFSDWQVRMAADIVRYCWAKYPNLKHIVSHALLDPSRRSDPGELFPWDDFKSMVLMSDEQVLPALVSSASEDILTPAVVPSCCMDIVGSSVTTT